MGYNTIGIYRKAGACMNKPRILVVGSANMDFICDVKAVPRPGETVLSDGSYFLAPGGKGANNAVAAARLGADVVLCARAGKDEYGDVLQKAYEKENMDCRFFFRDPKLKTGLAAIFREESGQNRIIVFPGANTALAKVDVEEAFTCYPDALLTQAEIDPDVAVYAAESAVRQGVPLFFDLAPCRPDLDLSRIPACEVVSPNETETLYYTGVDPKNVDGCLRAAIKLYKQIKTKYVVIKLGARGCYIYDGLHQDIVPSLNVRAADTTGAGDAFMAALAVRYLQNRGNILDAARYATCVAALSVTRSGAYASFPTEKELETFINDYNAGQ